MGSSNGAARVRAKRTPKGQRQQRDNGLQQMASLLGLEDPAKAARREQASVLFALCSLCFLCARLSGPAVDWLICRKSGQKGPEREGDPGQSLPANLPDQVILRNNPRLQLDPSLSPSGPLIGWAGRLFQDPRTIPYLSLTPSDQTRAVAVRSTASMSLPPAGHVSGHGSSCSLLVNAGLQDRGPSNW
ncbi:hypothetical protein B0J11DRAFT_507129 [Dendryphion nanum]|uniref:Uncharacterized protein n=1 Tax=Dendryphion nanum TaxID=256645 RepID=A0A9P9ILY1_9PLEO|nr:hypothetical protein B0J11DRAFT_507129 [Dendryphion nanum]